MTNGNGHLSDMVKKYKKKHAKYKELCKNNLDDITKLNNMLTDKERKLSIVQESYDDLHKEINGLRQTIVNQNEVIKDNVLKYDNLTNQMIELKRINSDIVINRDELQHKINENNNQIARFESEGQRLNELINDLFNKLEIKNADEAKEVSKTKKIRELEEINCLISGFRRQRQI